MTPALLIAGGIGPTQAAAFAPYLTQTFEQFGMTTPIRQAAFLGQCAHESTMFVHLEERLFYSSADRIVAIFGKRMQDAAAGLVAKPEALANAVYAGRNGNGDVASGDGFRYRGRGLIQLTGRNNYSAAAIKLAEPYIDQPDLVASAPDACLTAGWYWDRNGLNRLADGGKIDDITRAINGSAMDGAENRKKLFRTFLQVLMAPAASAP